LGPTSLANPGRTQTIEQTAKKYKLGMLLSYIPALIGFFGCAITLALGREGGPSSVGLAVFGVLFIIGVITYFLFRCLAWWHHG
jgi:hypothetical protein